MFIWWNAQLFSCVDSPSLGCLPARRQSWFCPVPSVGGWVRFCFSVSWSHTAHSGGSEGWPAEDIWCSSEKSPYLENDSLAMPFLSKTITFFLVTAISSHLLLPHLRCFLHSSCCPRITPGLFLLGWSYPLHFPFKKTAMLSNDFFPHCSINDDSCLMDKTSQQIYI